MSKYPQTPKTVQITRHWHLAFRDQATNALADSTREPLLRKLAADSAQSMADDLLDQLRLAHEVKPPHPYEPPIQCPVDGCKLIHGPVPGEQTSLADQLDAAIALYQSAKAQPPENRDGALMVARRAVLAAAQVEIKRETRLLAGQ